MCKLCKSNLLVPCNKTMPIYYTKNASTKLLIIKYFKIGFQSHFSLVTRKRKLFSWKINSSTVNTHTSKLTVAEQTGGQSEAHIDILPSNNSFQHYARHTLFISRCSDLIRGGCTPLCKMSPDEKSATPPTIMSGCQLNGSECFCKALS